MKTKVIEISRPDMVPVPRKEIHIRDHPETRSSTIDLLVVVATVCNAVCDASFRTSRDPPCCNNFGIPRPARNNDYQVWSHTWLKITPQHDDAVSLHALENLNDGYVRVTRKCQNSQRVYQRVRPTRTVIQSERTLNLALRMFLRRP